MLYAYECANTDDWCLHLISVSLCALIIMYTELCGQLPAADDINLEHHTLESVSEWTWVSGSVCTLTIT